MSTKTSIGLLFRLLGKLIGLSGSMGSVTLGSWSRIWFLEMQERRRWSACLGQSRFVQKEKRKTGLLLSPFQFDFVLCLTCLFYYQGYESRKQIEVADNICNCISRKVWRWQRGKVDAGISHNFFTAYELLII
jgi:hypothetical protein